MESVEDNKKLEEMVQVRRIILPQNFDASEFLEARIDEVAALNKKVRQKLPKLASQRIPRHMRRRAVAHNKRRLPTRVRQNLPDDPAKKKRPSRRHRRRPRNLLQEYQRRQRKNAWLETHIWYAKRFEMKELWGYKLPVRSYEKIVRSSFRGMSKYCLLSDISFMCCIELIGTYDTLIDKLQQLTSCKVGMTFKAKAFISGTSEGTTILYRSNQYPNSCIGPVIFLWKQTAVKETGSADPRHLWIWCHPAMYNDLLEELVRLFSLELTTMPCARVPSYTNEVLRIKMQSLKGTLNRFRLTGPLSLAVLTQALKPSILEKVECNEQLWWSNDVTIESSQKFADLWKFLSTSNPEELENVPRHSVLGCIFRDPRLDLPSKSICITLTKQELLNSSNRSNGLSSANISADSFLWDPVIRDSVTNTMVSETKINILRSQNSLVPGTELLMPQSECNHIPAILVKVDRPSQGYCSGWDLILPSGWGKVFWMSLIYRGAKPVGLRELSMISQSCGIPHFPNEWVDTKAGLELLNAETRELVDKYFRYPPAKRPNFSKLGILYPFRFPWDKIVLEWSLDLTEGPKITSSPYVLREQKAFLELKNFELEIRRSHRIPNLTLMLKEHCQSALIFIRLHCTHKGVPSRFSLICMPHKEDVTTIKLSKNQRIDPSDKLRRTLRCQSNHSDRPSSKTSAQCDKTDNSVELMTALPSAKEKSKKKKPSPSIERSIALVNGTASLPENITDHGCRKLMGCVTSGFRGFAVQKSTAQGYISLRSYVKLLRFCAENRCHPFVLLRAQNSLQYRYADLMLPVG